MPPKIKILWKLSFPPADVKRIKQDERILFMDVQLYHICEYKYLFGVGERLKCTPTHPSMSVNIYTLPKNGECGWNTKYIQRSRGINYVCFIWIVFWTHVWALYVYLFFLQACSYMFSLYFIRSPFGPITIWKLNILPIINRDYHLYYRQIKFM